MFIILNCIINKCIKCKLLILPILYYSIQFNQFVLWCLVLKNQKTKRNVFKMFEPRSRVIRSGKSVRTLIESNSRSFIGYNNCCKLSHSQMTQLNLMAFVLSDEEVQIYGGLIIIEVGKR